MVSINQSINQWNNGSTNQSINQSMVRPINQSIDQWIDNQSINRWFTQSINQSMDGQINQSMDRRNDHIMWKSFDQSEKKNFTHPLTCRKLAWNSSVDWGSHDWLRWAVAPQSHWWRCPCHWPAGKWPRWSWPWPLWIGSSARGTPPTKPSLRTFSWTCRRWYSGRSAWRAFRSGRRR